MKLVTLGLLLAASAGVLSPQVAAAQCEGGTSTAGFYLQNGTYVPGGCAYTSTTTPGQLHPSGAQPLPSTNPAAGTSALPGQPFGVGLLPVTSGDLGQPGAGGGQTQTLGPGSPGAGPVITLPGTLGGVNTLPGQLTATEGLPLTTGTASLSGASPATVLRPSLLPSAAVLTGGAAYGYSLPSTPPTSAQAGSLTAPRTVEGPPTPGRGGPTYIGEEGPTDTIISLPNE
jgi:hypothetical protein